MRLNPFAPNDNPMEKLLYCFGSGDDSGADDGDTGDTGVSASVAAGGRGWGPSRGEGDNDVSSIDSQDRRVDSRGNTTNFNIDRSQPSVTADVNGVTRTVYGSQANLDKAVAGGDINPVANVQNNYTPGTDAAVSAFNAAVGQQAPAAAGPALSGSAGDFEGVSFASTPITSQAAAGPALSGGYSPVTRAMSPFEMSLAESLGPRPDYVSSVRMGNFDDPEVQRTMAELDAISAKMGGDPYGPSPQQNMSPVDSINIFDQFEQPLDATTVDPSRPDLARDPSRPAVSIRAATPADMITAEARAAANQLLGPGRTRPTAEEVTAANARFAPSGMTEAEYAGGLAGSIGPTVGRTGPSSFQSPEDQAMGMSQYGMGMQPTTTEVDAYNQAVNQQYEADILGATSYKDSLYDAFNQGLPYSQAVNAEVAGRISLDPGVYDTQRMADVYGIDLPQQVAPTGIAGVNQMIDQAMREVELETGVPTSQLSGIMASGAQQRAVANRDQMAAEMTADQATPVDVARFTDPLTGGISDTPTLMSDIMDYYDERGSYAQIMNTLGDDAYRSRAEDGRLSPGVDYEIEDSRENVLGRAALNDIDRAIAEEEAFRAAQAEQATRAAEQQADADQFMDVSAIDVTRPGAASILGKDPRAPDYTLAEAQANLEAARAEAYRDKQFGFDTGLPTKFGDTGIPTGVGVLEGITDALFNPDAVLANAIAEYGIKSVDGGVAEGAANYNPQGLEVVTSGGPIGEGGRTVAYDARGNVVYDSAGMMDRIGDIFTGGTPENIEELYARQRTTADAERERQGGDGGERVLPPVEEAPAEAPVVDDQGRQIVKPYQYQPRGPLTYAYTGLPSLAPTRLRPTYTARKTFSPLFPVS